MVIKKPEEKAAKEAPKQVKEPEPTKPKEEEIKKEAPSDNKATK